MFIEKKDILLNKFSKKNEVKVRHILRTEQEPIVNALISDGLIKRKKKSKAQEPAMYVLTERGRQVCKKKFKK